MLPTCWSTAVMKSIIELPNRIMIASPNLRNGIPQEPRFSTAGEAGLFNHCVPPSEES